MRLSGIDVETLGPRGAARVVEVVPRGWKATPEDRGLTFDERNHLSGSRRGGWLAVTFHVAAPWDEEALARAVDAFVARHPTVHRLPGLAGSYRMTTLPRHATRPIDDTSPGGLERLLDDACAPALDDDGVPLGPAYRVLAWGSTAADDDADSDARGAQSDVTILAAFDHAHVDAWSMQLTVRDLESLYLAEVHAHSSTKNEPGPGGSRAAAQRADGVPTDTESLRLEPPGPGLSATEPPGIEPDGPRSSDTEPSGLGLPGRSSTALPVTADSALLPSRHDDARAGMARWHAFLDDGGLPTAPFPLDDLASTDGAHEVADTTGTPGLRTRTATFPLDGDDGPRPSLLPALLSALSRATQAVGGERRFRALLPVHTRRTPGSDEVLGWHVTNTPLAFDADATPDEVRAAVRDAVACAPVDLATMLATYPGEVTLGAVFTVSFLDYRRVPGHDAAQRTGAVQLSGRSPGSGVQLWFARTDDALHLRCRHPATAVADRTVTALLTHLKDEVRDALHMVTNDR